MSRSRLWRNNNGNGGVRESFQQSGAAQGGQICCFLHRQCFISAFFFKSSDAAALESGKVSICDLQRLTATQSERPLKLQTATLCFGQGLRLTFTFKSSAVTLFTRLGLLRVFSTHQKKDKTRFGGKRSRRKPAQGLLLHHQPHITR